MEKILFLFIIKENHGILLLVRVVVLRRGYGFFFIFGPKEEKRCTTEDCEGEKEGNFFGNG